MDDAGRLFAGTGATLRPSPNSAIFEQGKANFKNSIQRCEMVQFFSELERLQAARLWMNDEMKMEALLVPGSCWVAETDLWYDASI